MKSLTLHQPWASLVAWGEKRYETRSWATTHRGPLAIHASLNESELDIVSLNIFYKTAFKRHGDPLFTKLSYGMILCVVDLTAVESTEEIGPWLSASEEAFGDYSTGRWAWKFENLRVLDRPIQARGHQGLWEWPMLITQLEFMS